MRWIIGGVAAVGLTTFGLIWSEMSSIREDIGSIRGELGSVRMERREEIVSVREEVKENRARITDVATGLARIEAILEERLPRN